MYSKTGHDGSRQQDHEGVEHKSEQTEGQNGEREGENEQYRSEDAVDKSKDRGGHEGREKPFKAYTRENVSGNSDCKSI